MTENEMRGLFQDLRDEPLPSDSLARVRLRIAERMRARRMARITAWILAPVCALALATILRTPPRPVLPPAPREVSVAPELEPRVEPAVIRSQPRQARPQKQRARRDANIPPLIRIETPDPEVVILLVGN